MPGDSVQPAVGADRRSAGAGAQKVADRQRGMIVTLEIPAAGFGADGTAAIVEKAGPLRPRQALGGCDVDPEARPRAELGETVVDAVALIVADINRVAETASAD